MQNPIPSGYYVIDFELEIEAAAFVAAFSRFLNSPEGAGFKNATEPPQVWAAPLSFRELYLTRSALEIAGKMFGPLPKSTYSDQPIPRGSRPLLDSLTGPQGLEDIQKRSEKFRGRNAEQIAHQFWGLMQTNDFRSVGNILADEYVLDYPQSGERIRGRDNLAAMNEAYPAHGPWKFIVNRIVGNDDEAVSDVSVTDGVQNARVLSFFTVQKGKIVRMVEFWPEDFAAPENRKHLVEKIEEKS